MKALPPLGHVRRSLTVKFESVRSSRFFGDRLNLAILAIAFGTSGLNFLLLFLRLPLVRSDVPLSYSSLHGFEGLGPWYGPVLVTLFGVVVAIVNTVFAFQAFTRSRLSSFFLLVGSVVVVFFCFIISNAFATVGQ